MKLSDIMEFIKHLRPPVRCPSAPPYEAEAVSPGDTQTVSSFSSEAEKHREGLTPPSHRMHVQRSNNQRTDVQSSDIRSSDVQWTHVQRSEGGSEQTFHRDGAPQLDESFRLYPSLSLWTITVDTQVRRVISSPFDCQTSA